MLLRLVLLLLLASAAAAQPVPDTLRAPAGADDIIAYGWTVEADGDRVLVGARIWPPPYPRAAGIAQRADHHGIVFVYRLQPDGAWALEGELRADYLSSEDCFSWTLDLQGDLAAVGAECEYRVNDDGSYEHGAVYLYRYVGGEWVREAKLHSSDIAGEWAPGSYFGKSVSLGDGYLVVGGSVRNPSNPDGDSASGAAYVFEPEGGAWRHVATLVNDDAGELLNEGLGAAVAAFEGGALVGAPGARVGSAEGAGAVYVFQRSGGVWSQHQKLEAPRPAPGGDFGRLFAADGRRAAIASGWGAVYPAEEVAGTWQIGAPLVEGLDYLGGVAQRGDHTLVLKADFRDPAGYLFTQREAGWAETILPLEDYDLWRDETVSLGRQHAFIGHSATDEGGYVLVYDLAQLVAAEAVAPEVPSLVLSVAPNPSRGTSTLHFALPSAGVARVVVYDVLGREVARVLDGVLAAGAHAIQLDVGVLPAGLYPVRLEVGGQAVTRLLTVLR